MRNLSSKYKNYFFGMAFIWKFVCFFICINAAKSELKKHKILRNLALHKPASQSTTHTVFKADLAVDGIRQTYWSPPYCSHTHLEYYPYWYVDLGGQHEILNVQIVNRLDTAANLRDISVVVAQKKGEYDQTCGHFRGPGTHYPLVNIGCPVGTRGRFVKVQMVSKSKRYLILCEVEVHGY